MTNTNCPKCGSDSFDTIRWSPKEGVTPYAEYYECCSCNHAWDESDLKEEEDEQ